MESIDWKLQVDWKIVGVGVQKEGLEVEIKISEVV